MIEARTRCMIFAAALLLSASAQAAWRGARLAQLEKASAPTEAERGEIDVLRRLAKYDANRPPPTRSEDADFTYYWLKPPTAK